jgi:outer membrane protein assembly factor BamB
MTLLSGGLIKRWRWKGMGILAGILCVLLLGVSSYQAYQTRNVPAPLASSVELSTFHDEKLGIFAWHAHDGSLAWRSSLNGYQPVCTQQACYLLQDTVISPGTEQAREHLTVLALRASDGKLLWQRHIPLQGNASGSNAILAVFGQHLYLGVVAHWLDAMSTLDGALLWQRQVGLPLGETLLEANGVVYTPSGISIFRPQRPVRGRTTGAFACTHCAW